MMKARGSFDVTAWNEETYEELDGAEASGSWTVIAGSGTGDLEELRGTGSFRAPHGSHATFELDFELG